jgi:C4-dicarboxylate-specific signal transduction histidine kinase
VFDGLRALFRKVDQGMQPIDVNKVIFGVLQSLRTEMKNHAVELRSELSPDLPLVDGNGSQLEEVISNLARIGTGESKKATLIRGISAHFAPPRMRG